MARTVSDVMTRRPVTIQAEQPIRQAAELMRTNDIGDVLVLDDGQLAGLVTDRDIAIRVVAERLDPSAPVREACSGDLATVSPHTPLDQVVQLMRDRAIRRVPVVEDGAPVGVLSIGDLAMERDQHSALAGISAARSNR